MANPTLVCLVEAQATCRSNTSFSGFAPIPVWLAEFSSASTKVRKLSNILPCFEIRACVCGIVYKRAPCDRDIALLMHRDELRIMTQRTGSTPGAQPHSKGPLDAPQPRYDPNHPRRIRLISCCLVISSGRFRFCKLVERFIEQQVQGRVLF